MRDPRPSIISPKTHGGGALWASGLFDDMDAWMEQKGVGLQVNCLGSRKHNRAGIALHVDMDSPSGLFWRMCDALPKVLIAMSQGKDVLVHCAPGVHRTGSFITLLFALVEARQCKLTICFTALITLQLLYSTVNPFCLVVLGFSVAVHE